MSPRSVGGRTRPLGGSIRKVSAPVQWKDCEGGCGWQIADVPGSRFCEPCALARRSSPKEGRR